MSHPSRISKRLNGVVFGYYHPEEIRKLSVKEINNPIAFDHINRPKKGIFLQKFDIIFFLSLSY